MKLITTIPIYRNRFQKPAWFFSTQNFSVGALVFTSYPLNNKIKNKKPALVIQVEDLERNKFFLRKNKIKISKLDNSSQFFLFKKKTIELIFLISQQMDLSIEKSLQKLFSKKIRREINQLSPDKTNDIRSIQKYINDKLTLTFINKKILGHATSKSKYGKHRKYKGIQTIGAILSKPLKKKTSLHSENHYLVDEIRNYFNETSKRGVGSFSFYLGFFKKIPKITIYQYWSEVKSSRKSIKDQQKLFWWKVGQYLKKKD